MLLPGPEAQQLATYIGWLLHRTRGGIVAVALFVLPSMFILLALSWMYAAYGHGTAVAGVLHGFKPAVTASIAAAMIRIGRRAFRNWALWSIAVMAFVCIYFLQVPFPLIVLGAGLVGLVGLRFAPKRFESVGAGHPTQAGDELLPHAQPSRERFGRQLLVGLLLWAVPMIALTAITAAIVGVILNLAVFFGQGVLFPDRRPDRFAAVLAVICFVGLVWFRWNIIAVVLGCGVMGLVWKLWMGRSERYAVSKMISAFCRAIEIISEFSLSLRSYFAAASSGVKPPAM
jgi:chromate transport protein ChrA